MPGTTATPEVEIIVEDIGGGGGGPAPPPDGGDDGDGGGDDRKRRRKWSPSPKRYSTAITIGIVSILMFFMALASAFIVLRRGSELWVTFRGFSGPTLAFCSQAVSLWNPRASGSILRTLPASASFG